MAKAYRARFWAKVEKRGPSDCWEWLGARDEDGYGRFRLRGKNVGAHRLAWVISNRGGEIPEGKVIMHVCDNPGCVNPAHLRLATQRMNMKDMWAKGRGLGNEASIRRPRGEAHHAAKLNESDVLEIRRLFAAGISHGDLAAKFGVTKSQIYSVIARRTWRWLE